MVHFGSWIVNLKQVNRRKSYKIIAGVIRKILLTGTQVFLFSAGIHAQELEARSYSVLPKDMHASALSYTFSKGNVISDMVSPIQDLKVTTSAVNLGYFQTFAFLNKLARVQVALPVGYLSGTAKLYGVDTSGTRSGFLDARIKFGVNLIGSPVLAPKDFVRFQEHTVLGASLVVSVPTGQYFSDKLINLGTNRWGFKPEVGFSRREGRLYYELYTGVWLFTENNAFLKTSTLVQQPLLTLQAHVDYVFKAGMWLAVNGGLARGGEGSIDGVEQDDQQRNWRLGTTFSVPLNKHQSVKAMVNTGVATRAGQNYTAVTVIYQYIWF